MQPFSGPFHKNHVMQKVATSTTTNVRTQCKTKVVLEVIRQNTRPSMRFFLCPTSFKMYIQEFWGANLHQCFNNLLMWKVNSSNQVSNQQEERFHGFGNISTFPHCKLSFSSVQLIGTVVSLILLYIPSYLSCHSEFCIVAVACS